MKWYYKHAGIHTHVRVFMNGGKCGDLCFRTAEFDELRAWMKPTGNVEFINETPVQHYEGCLADLPPNKS